MPVNSTHADYDAAIPIWLRARDVLSGEDAVKAAGDKYVPRLDSQTDEDFRAYVQRASFFNATARTAEAYEGLIFRRSPFLKLPENTSALGRALADFNNDTDMLGTPLTDYAKKVVNEVIGVGRGGTLVDWEGEAEKRAYAAFYAAEDILNWRVQRINGRNLVTMVVLREVFADGQVFADNHGDEFVPQTEEQIRVLKLVDGSLLSVDGGKEKGANAGGPREMAYVVDIWRREDKKTETQGTASQPEKAEWNLVQTLIPLRLGKPLPLIPFIFHGPHHARPEIDKLPLADVISLNLSHYRLSADYRHGMHYTALPTAWVSGFEKGETLPIGSRTAWVTDMPGASAGFLEYTGQGLMTFERAMDRDERQMAVMGSRLLEPQKKVGETAAAIELRQSGENSILSNIAATVGSSLTQVLRWVYWWNSTEGVPDELTNEQILLQLNTDYSLQGLTSQEILAIVAAWQAKAISRDTMFDLFRRGEILPDGRTNEEEAQMLKVGG